MSAGEFVIKTYAASYSGTANHPIRVQPETLEFSVGANANGDAIGGVNNPISAQVSQSRRALGLNARMVSFRWDAGQAPAGYQARATVRIPWLQRTGFSDIAKGQVATYLGGTGKVVNTFPEKAN